MPHYKRSSSTRRSTDHGLGEHRTYYAPRKTDHPHTVQHAHSAHPSFFFFAFAFAFINLAESNHIGIYVDIAQSGTQARPCTNEIRTFMRLCASKGLSVDDCCCCCCWWTTNLLRPRLLRLRNFIIYALHSHRICMAYYAIVCLRVIVNVCARKARSLPFTVYGWRGNTQTHRPKLCGYRYRTGTRCAFPRYGQNGMRRIAYSHGGLMWTWVSVRECAVRSVYIVESATI